VGRVLQDVWISSISSWGLLPRRSLLQRDMLNVWVFHEVACEGVSI